jgi:5-methylcytosine-specific restriction endonuclease McrA
MTDLSRRVPKPCTNCGTLTTTSRCNRCRGSSTDRGYDWRWQKARAAVLDRDGYRCRWCGRPANTVDHVVALADGGARLDPANLVAACRPCNSKRGAETAQARKVGGRGPGADNGRPPRPPASFPGGPNGSGVA